MEGESGEKKQTEKEGEETGKIKPIESTRGRRRALAIYKLYFPLGMYQRALEWDLMESLPSSSTLETDDDFKGAKGIHILATVETVVLREAIFSSASLINSIVVLVIVLSIVSNNTFKSSIIQSNNPNRQVRRETSPG